MRVVAAVIVVLFSATACAQPPARTGVEEVERARDIVEQLDERTADIEDRGSGGD